MKPETGELIIREKPNYRVVFLLLLGVGWAVGGVWMIKDGLGRIDGLSILPILAVVGGLVLALASIGLLVGVAFALKPATLLLTSNGFWVRGFRKRRFHRWADVSKFEVLEKDGLSLVRYFYCDVDHQSIGYREAWLADEFGERPQRLAAILNEWRQTQPASISNTA